MTMRIRSWMQRGGTAGIALAVAALSILSFGDAAAQRLGQRGDVIIESAGPPGTDYNVSQARRERGFRLFAGADAAGVGMHGTGNFSYALDNYSPCDAPLSGFCAWNVNAARGAVTFQFFEVIFNAAVPPSQWAKARKLAPALANARGGGYSYVSNFGLFSGRAEFGPRDNTLAKLFSGVASTSDGSCRDNTGFANGYYPTGLPLLASSNCPDTWAGGVWGGDREVTQEGWKQLFDADPDGFRWDYWRVPEDAKKAGMFMGTNFSTYGESSDHWQEILGTYGSAIPGGTGDPGFDGYPLGLVWHFEAFNFGVPALSGVVFLRSTVINRSEDVYGVPIDWDSLYLGFAPGTGGSGSGGGQRFSNYYLPQISTALYHQSWNVPGGPCTESARTVNNGCSSEEEAKYNNGGNAIIVLKSPIGDLRNKLFSNPGSPFYDMNNPAVGDTITFNHGHMCGYIPCWNNTIDVSDKRGFGMISSTEDNILDGRPITSIDDGQLWIVFRTKQFPTIKGRFNKYVPGVQGPPAATWDYNHDGVPDTLFYDSCADQGCVATSADTLPGGQISAYGNVGGQLDAGPFSLAAGDSTSWYVALVGEADSTRTWAAINASIDLYMNFFLSPEAPPPVTIASTQLTAGTDPNGSVTPQVRFFFDDAPERWVDPFLAKLANDMRTDPAYAQLVADNPTLPDDVEARSRDNLEQIEIYKSCNGGNSWTSNGDCVGDPASDETGAAAGLGWEAYQIYNVDANNGDVPNVFTDRSVQGGRTYLYAVVAKSRGARFNVITPSGPDVIEFAPSIRNVLSRSSSDPNVLSVYIPASRPAGYQAAEIDFTESGRATVPFSIDVSDAPIAGRYSIQFGNSITVQRDSAIADDATCGDAGTVCRSRVIVEREVEASPTGDFTVVRSDTLTREGADVIPVAGTPDLQGASTVGNIHRTDDLYSGLGFVAMAGTTPIFVSNTLTGSAATPTGVFALADFPGFTVTADNTVAGDFNTSSDTLVNEQAFRGDATRQRMNLPATAVRVPRGDVDNFMVQWREQESEPTTYGVGRYVIHWASDPFGLPNGLSGIDPANPSAAETELTNGLESRPAATTGLTDAATATLLSDVLGFTVTQQDLLPIRIPFTVRNTTFDRDVSLAAVDQDLLVAGQAVAYTYVLGRNEDTIRVSIPRNEWVPGEELYFIESVTRDSVDASGYTVLSGGQPIQVTGPQVTFSSAIIGCTTPNPPYCNPLNPSTSAASGYLPLADGDSAQFTYNLGFDPNDQWVFDLTPPVVGDAITQVTDSALSLVRVVPNPFVVYSQYQTSVANSQVLFTNVPPTGTIRVYTLSGQLVQQITWDPSDLTGTGDIAYNLKSREDIDIASGLYIWVLTAPSNPNDDTSAPVTARGKFVVIRGQSR